MVILISGEGNSDVGNKDKLGPMSKLVNYLLDSHKCKQYEIEFIAKQELTKTVTQNRGKKKNLPYFSNNAYQLAKIANEKSKESEIFLAILFRDADTTNKKEWQEKYDSIVHGFKMGECNKGIPMLPQPCSESWLLSATLNSNKMKYKDEKGSNKNNKLDGIGNRDLLKEILAKKINNCNVNDFNFNFANISENLSSYSKFKQDLIVRITNSHLENNASIGNR